MNSPDSTNFVGSFVNNSISSDNTLSDKACNLKTYSLKNISIASLNVCGLKRRLEYPEFQELVNNFEVFCVSESKLDKHDIISLKGYTYVSQIRKQRYLRKSGGIGIFIKNELYRYVSVIDSDSDYILWIKFDKLLFGTPEDVVLGAVYLPPGDSRFNTQDELDLFEVEITNMCI